MFTMSILNRYTVNGAIQTAVARFDARELQNFGEAAVSVETGLLRNVQSAGTNPYHNVIGAGIYNVPGLSGDWADIAKAFVGPLGASLGNTFAPRQQQQAAPAPEPVKDNTSKILIMSGVGLLGAFVLYRMVSR